MLTIGSMFSGIGGLELGLERAGLGRVVWQCENEPYPRRVLAKHWPDAHRYQDVTCLHAIIRNRRQRGRGPWRSEHDVDIICGGFPCQDLSAAGKGAGLDGARSGLFFELMRTVRLVRPWIVVLENVPTLVVRGLGRVLGALHEAGYDATWGVISALSLGAPHIRERIVVVAQRSDDRLPDAEPRGSGAARAPDNGTSRAVADAHGVRELQQGRVKPDSGRRSGDGCGAVSRQGVANPKSERRETRPMPERDAPAFSDACGCSEVGQPSMGDANRPRLALGQVFGGDAQQELTASFGAGCARGGVWCAQPGVGRGPDGLPAWLDRPAWERGLPRVKEGVPSRTARLKALGNAVVPQVAEFVGRRIKAAMEVAA